MQEESKNREALPVHSVRTQKDVEGHVVRVDGAIAERLELTLEQLERLPQEEFIDDFTCLEGWTVRHLKWRGVLLDTVLAVAKARPEARYVQASAGNFSISLVRDHAQGALLAIRLNDEPLPPKHGGPVRLIVPGGQCFTSIKWLDHLEIRMEAGANTAESTALNRLRKYPS